MALHLNAFSGLTHEINIEPTIIPTYKEKLKQQMLIIQNIMLNNDMRRIQWYLMDGLL